MSKNRLFLILLLLLSLLSLSDFFRPGLPITHDGQDHVARIANFYQSFTEGNFIPRWAANLNWGYGHPILMFLYPLPSYVASLFHRLNFSLIDSTKITFGLSYVLSGIFMYLWIKEIWGERAGFVAAVVYMFTPYRFVDLYVRGAIGECWAFVWPPLVCYFALKLSQKYFWWYLVGGSLSLTAMILSHNALSLMFLCVVIGYFGYLIFISNNKLCLTINCLLITIFGFGCSFFYWFPAFFEGKYTLRDIVTKGNITGFEPLTRLLWSKWAFGGTGSFSVQLGLLQWLIIFFVPIIIWKLHQKKDQSWIWLSLLLATFLLSICLILPVAKPLYLHFSLLQKFQFAWRWLSLAIFIPPIFAAGLIYLLPKKIIPFVVCCLLFVVLLLNRNYWHAQDFLVKSDNYFSQPYSSPTDTGESAPRWSVRFMEKFPQVKYQLIEGKGTITEINRNTTRHIIKIKANTPLGVVDNTLYFPNWQVLVDNQPTTIQFQDPAWRGLITFNILPGEHQVEVRFEQTRLRRLSDYISLIGLGIIVFRSIIKLVYVKKA